MSYFRNLFSAIIGRPVTTAPVLTVDSARAAITTALSDSRYEFRTIGALVKAVGNGATESFVNSVIDGMSGVRRAYGKSHLIGLTDKVGTTPRGFAY